MRKGQAESEVLKQCLEYLKLRGFYVWRNNSGAVKNGKLRFGLPGSSDILGILPNGQFLAVECKKENGGKLSDKQVEFLSRIKENGGVAVCVHSVNELEKIITSTFTSTKA